MSSKAADDQMLTPKEVKEVNEIVKNIQTKTLNLLSQNPNLIRVILMGITGSGKSSLACSLAQKDLTIHIGKGKKVELVGDGVESGCQSATREPSITIDQKSGMIYCDCPGFEDTEGFLQEIINSFCMDCLFKKQSPTQSNKFKIMLVAGASEFDASRGKGVLQSIKRLEEMFTDHSKLKNGMGIIVTKGDNDMTGIDYIESLNDNVADKFKEWCAFFDSHKERVFTFPKPLRSSENEKYIFKDRTNLINFLKTNLIVDPDHKIALSETARLKMKNLRAIHTQIVSDKINVLCGKISNQFRKEQKSDEMGKWIDTMHELLKTRVKCAKDFAIVVKKHIPNSQQYESDFINLAEFEIFDKFIDDVLYDNQDTSCLNEAVRAWSHQAIIELEKSQTQALKTEFQEKEISKQKEMIAKQDQLQKEHERKVEEMKQMLAQQTRSFEDQQRRIESLQNTIAQQSREISNLRNSGGRGGCLLI